MMKFRFVCSVCGIQLRTAHASEVHGKFAHTEATSMDQLLVNIPPQNKEARP